MDALLRGHVPADRREVALVVDDPDQDVVLDEHARAEQLPGRVAVVTGEVGPVDPLETGEDLGDLVLVTGLHPVRDGGVGHQIPPSTSMVVPVT